MPALAPVGQVLRIGTRMAVGALINAIITDHYSYTGTAPTAAQLDTVAQAVWTQWGSDLAGLFTMDRSIEEVTVTDLTSPTSAVGTYAAAANGTRTDVGLPASVCLVQQRKVDRRYRGGHSRQYWPAGGDTSVHTAQTWDPVFTAQWSTQYALYTAAIEAMTWTGGGIHNAVNVSYYFGFTNVLYPSGRYHVKPTPRVTPLVDVIASFSVNPKFGSQRRRDEQSA